MRKTTVRVTQLLIALCAAVGCESNGGSRGDPQFFVNSIRFSEARGWVRTHMEVELNARCKGDWGYDDVRVVQGDLPPGLILAGGEFTGTPYRAGAWLAQVQVIAPSCNNNVYPDKYLWVRFSVGGEPPGRGF